MSDVTVLLLTFFMLTSTFLQKEPITVITPSSVSEIKVPTANLVTVLVSPKGNVFISLAGDKDSTFSSENMRAELIKSVAAEYNRVYGKQISLTAEEVMTFAKTNMFGVSLAELKGWLDLSQEQRDAYIDPTKNPKAGIPIDMNQDLSKPNEFQIWMRAIYNSSNPNIEGAIKRGEGIAIKADKSTTYEKIQVVMDNLQTMKISGKGKSHQKKMSIHVDFTPMVDMNMLLITFFMLCTTMIKSQTLQISLPTNEKVEKEQQNKVKQSEAITVILDSDVNDEGVPTKNYLYYYEGMPPVTEEGKIDIALNPMKTEEFLPNEANGAAQGMRKIFQDRNKEVVTRINELKAKWKNKELASTEAANDSVYQARAKEIRNDSTLKRPVVIIKATPNASYESLVTALDEMQINSISRYQIDRISHNDSVMMMAVKGIPYGLEETQE